MTCTNARNLSGFIGLLPHLLTGLPTALAWVAAGVLALSHPVGAQPSEPSPELAASCVEVEVNGQRIRSFACLTQQLQPGTTQPRVLRAPGLPAEAITQRPGNQLGLFNQQATSNRMGNTFGRSVLPQRPPTAVPGSPLIPRAQP